MARPSRSELAIVVTAGLGAGHVHAAWSDDFDNNSFDQAWTFFSLPSDSGSASITDVPSTTDDHLAMTAPSGSSEQLAVGYVASQAFSNAQVSAWVNETGTGSGHFDIQTDHFLFARAALSGSGIDSAYALQVDWELESISLHVIKVAANAEVPGEFGTAGEFFSGVDTNQRFWAQLTVTGDTTPLVVGNLYNAPGGSLLATATYTDTTGSPYGSGFSGVAPHGQRLRHRLHLIV